MLSSLFHVTGVVLVAVFRIRMSSKKISVALEIVIRSLRSSRSFRCCRSFCCSCSCSCRSNGSFLTGSFSIAATNQRGNGTRSREGIEEQIHGASMLSSLFHVTGVVLVAVFRIRMSSKKISVALEIVIRSLRSSRSFRCCRSFCCSCSCRSNGSFFVWSWPITAEN